MTGFRRLLHGRQALAMLVAMLALGVRLLIPDGYMPNAGPGPMITLCTGHGPVLLPDPDHKAPAHSDHVEPCGFGGLVAPLASAAPLLVVAPAIILAALPVPGLDLGLRVSPTPRLRPPLRAPPATDA